MRRRKLKMVVPDLLPVLKGEDPSRGFIDLPHLFRVTSTFAERLGGGNLLMSKVDFIY